MRILIWSMHCPLFCRTGSHWAISEYCSSQIRLWNSDYIASIGRKPFLHPTRHIHCKADLKDWSIAVISANDFRALFLGTRYIVNHLTEKWLMNCSMKQLFIPLIRRSFPSLMLNYVSFVAMARKCHQYIGRRSVKCEQCSSTALSVEEQRGYSYTVVYW